VTKRGEQNNLDIENSFDRSLSLNSIWNFMMPTVMTQESRYYILFF
jgi:hypothetical protein